MTPLGNKMVGNSIKWWSLVRRTASDASSLPTVNETSTIETLQGILLRIHDLVYRDVVVGEAEVCGGHWIK